MVLGIGLRSLAVRTGFCTPSHHAANFQFPVAFPEENSIDFLLFFSPIS